MRFQNKYKSYDQSIQIFEKFPLRVLKFKNTKWKRIQKLLLSNFSKTQKKKKLKDGKSKKIRNNLFVKVDFKTWEKIKIFYQNGRKITNLIFNIFDQAFTNSELKVNLLGLKASGKILDVYRQTILKPEFKLSILLWRLNLFCSSFQASQAIDEKKVIVNGKAVGNNFSILKGDIIYLITENYKKNTNIRKSKIEFSFSDTVSTFVEIDYYSNLIVVIKDLKNLSEQDLYFIKPEFCNLKKIKDYI
jgi:ribosomal protein S4